MRPGGQVPQRMLEAVQVGNGIRCCVDEKGHVVGVYQVAEVFTADLDPWFLLHMPQEASQ